MAAARAGSTSCCATTAATINAYAGAGATHIAVNAAESDADLERFVGFLAHQVAPLLP